MDRPEQKRLVTNRVNVFQENQVAYNSLEEPPIKIINLFISNLQLKIYKIIIQNPVLTTIILKMKTINTNVKIKI